MLQKINRIASFIDLIREMFCMFLMSAKSIHSESCQMPLSLFANCFCENDTLTRILRNCVIRTAKTTIRTVIVIGKSYCYCEQTSLVSRGIQPVRLGKEISVIIGSQVSLRVDCCKRDDVLHNTTVTKP